LLEQKSARRASDSPSEGEGKRVNSLEFEAIGKDQKRYTFVHAKTLQGMQKSKNPLRIQGEKLREESGSPFLRARISCPQDFQNPDILLVCRNLAFSS
jgi:hypothetical protein